MNVMGALLCCRSSRRSLTRRLGARAPTPQHLRHLPRNRHTAPLDSDRRASDRELAITNLNTPAPLFDGNRAVLCKEGDGVGRIDGYAALLDGVAAISIRHPHRHVLA